MKSAYAVLGVPGNASATDVEEAFKKATAHYSHARLVEDPEAMPRLMEIKEAYKLLSNPDMRAAHDRKLSSTVNRPVERPRVVIETEAAPWYSKPLSILAMVVVAVFAIGTYMNHSRDQMRKVQAAQAAHELAQKQLEADAAAQAQAAQDKLDVERARARSLDENRERQLRSESSAVARNAAYNDLQQQALVNRQIEAERREARRRESEAKSEDRQRVYEAQRRLSADQRRIRELCYQQYGRTNC